MERAEYTDQQGQTYTGFGLMFGAEEATVGSRLRYSWNNAVDFVRIVRLSLQMLVTGEAGLKDVSGPVGIVSTITDVGEQAESASAAVENIAYLAALVAVNLASEEPYHNALNEKLVKETIELAEQVNHTEVHLVGAYPVTPINIAIELPEFDPSVYNDAIRGQHLLAMKALRQKFGINENMTHVEKGLPEEVIPDLAEHLQAGIVVLGTVGRTGISAAFLGNTAEQVIDHLRCDLLVIKPDQYQTPVELDDEEDD